MSDEISLSGPEGEKARELERRMTVWREQHPDAGDNDQAAERRRIKAELDIPRITMTPTAENRSR
jgi:hypothetical protein